MKHTFELTPAQLNAVMSMANLVEEQIDCGEWEPYMKKNLRLIDRMLQKNGWERYNY